MRNKQPANNVLLMQYSWLMEKNIFQVLRFCSHNLILYSGRGQREFAKKDNYLDVLLLWVTISISVWNSEYAQGVPFCVVFRPSLRNGMLMLFRKPGKIRLKVRFLIFLSFIVYSDMKENIFKSACSYIRFSLSFQWKVFRCQFEKYWKKKRHLSANWMWIIENLISITSWKNYKETKRNEK